MYRVTVTCAGLNETEGSGAVADVLEEFSHREWHANPACEWKDGILRFSATSDVDKDGLALLDEFGDAIHATINYSGNIRIDIESIHQIERQGI
jgi:hypothetical protein